MMDKFEALAQAFLRAQTEGMERALKGGKREALLPYIAYCLDQGKIPPRWAGDLLTGALNKYPKSWDDVFGRPGLHWGGQRFCEEWRIVSEGIKMILGEGRKVDAVSFFEDLAARVGMGASTVKRRFYSKRGRALLGVEIKIMLVDAEPEVAKHILKTTRRLNITF
jgi:hypothetical protein